MQTYFFNLLCDGRMIYDPDGSAFANDEAAKQHGVSVVRELLRRNEVKKRPWLLEVVGSEGQELFEIPFELVDSSIAHLPSKSRKLVQQICRSRRELSKTVAETRVTVLRTRATIARSRQRPYLAAEDGRRV